MVLHQRQLSQRQLLYFEDEVNELVTMLMADSVSLRLLEQMEPLGICCRSDGMIGEITSGCWSGRERRPNPGGSRRNHGKNRRRSRRASSHGNGSRRGWKRTLDHTITTEVSD